MRPLSDTALLSLVRIVVYARAKYRCEYPTCGALCFLEVHHAKSQRNLAVKFDPDCCVLLCSRHHQQAEKNRKALVNKLIATGIRHKGWADYLHRQEQTIVGNKDEFKKAAEATVRKEVSELGIFMLRK